MAKGLSAAKAKRILEDGKVRGKALTEKQKKFFGAVAGGATPLKKLNGGWLEKFDNGGVQPNYNDSNVSLPPGFKGYGYDKGGRAYNGAWDGPVTRMGGTIPGATGMMYARTSGTSPEEPKKAQDGTVMYGTPEYEAAYREGRFADVPNQLEEVVVTAGVDYEKYPLYDKLSAQQKEYFNDPGAIGRGVRRSAQTDRGLAEDTRDMVTGMLVQQPLAALQAPQSLMVEGIEALRGRDANFLNALTFDTQRTPSQAFNVENPYGAFALDVVADPMNLIGAGLAKKSITAPFKNALKANPSMYYRGIGQAGLDDALQSGLLRAKPSDQIAPAMFGPFDLAKRFSNLYVTPRLGVAQSYGKGVVAEVPRDVAGFSRRYKGSDWSMMTNNQIPIEQVNLYKKNFFGNYRPVNVPSSTSSNLIEASADPSVRQTLKNLTVSNLTNPLSDTRVGLTELMGLIKGGRFKSKYKGFNESGVKAASDFGKTWQKAPGFQTRFDDFTYQVNDPVLTRQVRNNQNLYNQGLEKLKAKQPDLFTPNDELAVPLSTIQKMFPRLADDAMLLKRLNDQIVEGASKINYANNARMNADQIGATGRFTKVMKPTSADDINYFADNPNTLGFFRASENRALIDIDRFESNYRNLSKKNWKLSRTVAHENKHAMDAGARATRPEYARTIQSAVPQVTDDYTKVLTGANKKDIKKVYGNIKNLGDDTTESIEYLSRPQEVAARVDELRMEYIPKKFWGTDKQYEVSDDLINKIISEGKAGKTSVDVRFFKMIKDKEAFKNLFKVLPAVAAPVAIGTAQQKNGGWLDKFQEGGVIEDDRGQWAHPGKVTKINSNNITMKGVNYPVLGVSDTGDTKMMQPGVDNYKYDGNSVTEYPMAKDGKSLVELNQLTNFTNYNTPQPGGWLDKY